VAGLGAPPPALRSTEPGRTAVLLGQYLAAMGLVTLEEETELHLAMVRGAVAAGFRTLVFKPHPTAPPLLAGPLVEEAVRLGASMVVHDSPELVETWFRSESVGCVVGCFSTALMTAATGYDLPTARVGTELLLDRLRPYQNSNRIPVTIIDAVLPPVSQLAADRSTGSVVADAAPDAGTSPSEVQRLVHAVSYCMQPKRYPALRTDAERLLADPGSGSRRYFKRRRLTLLDLPGRLPESPRRQIVPPPVRLVVKRALGPSVSARVSSLSRRLAHRDSRSKPTA